MQLLIDSFIVGAGQQIYSVDLGIRQLVGRQALDVFLQGVVVIGAVMPRLLGRASLFWQELSLALVCILLVFCCLCASIL